MLGCRTKATIDRVPDLGYALAQTQIGYRRTAEQRDEFIIHLVGADGVLSEPRGQVPLQFTN